MSSICSLKRGARNAIRHTVDSLLSASYEDKEVLGSVQGSQWTIRTGDLNERSVVYSGGVGGDIGFEIELIRRFGLFVVIFDPSPIAVQTLEKHAGQPEMKRIDFRAAGLAGECSFARFCASNVPGEWMIADDSNDQPSFRFECTTIEAEMKKRGHSRIDVLKLDIEGFEYDVLDHCLFNNIGMNQICVEFHDFMPHISQIKTLSTIRALYRRNFRLVHKYRHDMTFYTTRRDERQRSLQALDKRLAV